MAEKKDELIKIVGAENVIDDPVTLDGYSRDHSFTAAKEAPDGGKA